MQREIKFRVWNAREKKMWYIGSTNGFQFYTATLDFKKGWKAWRSRDVIASSESTDDRLLQFTGLKDKNGKEIYEGDIVDFNYRDTEIGRGEVGWDDMYSGFSVQNTNVYFGSSLFQVGRAHKDYTVIGNIFENPSLIS